MNTSLPQGDESGITTVNTSPKRDWWAIGGVAAFALGYLALALAIHFGV